MGEPIIEISHLMKTYKLGGETVHALNNVSIEIKKGEFLAIIGPSGSGKSTLMNMIGCLDRPQSGKYLLDGKDIGKMNDNQLAMIRNQKIGFIFQNFNLLTKLTALENVELPLLYAGLPAKQRREKALEGLTKVGLIERAGHLPTQLSGGQQQRVAIARALAGNPAILLADEPTGALDSKTSIEILEVMKELNELGHTIILITHDLAIAKQARRMVSIQDGELLENGGEPIGNIAIY
ncbi:ABC transporter ATP-binding protein [Neobacillus soli]|uniref:ABC transporter ATP-binding protein n=1 Tax=Neobacillus soli TaxID=220688 RepID=UPI0008254721|nr:ABC transporter ATP-binding protein [Neobacillus soli]